VNQFSYVDSREDADGSLTGYGGGLERKQWLLAHEGWHELQTRGKVTVNIAPSASVRFAATAAPP
jgi:hypothetical protein